MPKSPKKKPIGTPNKTLSQVLKKGADPALVEITLHPKVKELRKLLTDGTALETVALFVQKEMGLFLDLGIETVLQHLKTYRGTIPAWEFKDTPEAWTAARVEMAVRQGVVKKIDVIAEMEALVFLQQERITRGATLERLDEEGALNPLIGKEIERQAANLRTLAVLYGDVKLLEAMRGGSDDKSDPNIIDAEVVPGTPLTVTTALHSPESRQKVLSVLHQLKALGKPSPVGKPVVIPTP